MKRMLLLAVALLFAIAMAAQDTNTGGTSAPANVGQAQPGQPAANAEHHHHGAGASAARENTLTGCLNGPNAENAYVLTTKKNKKGFQVGMPGSDELSKHVGHKVKLTGTWARSGAEIGENEKTEHEKGEKHFQVTKIDHLADSCTMGGSAANGPSGDNRGAISSTTTDDKVTKKDQEKQKQESSKVPK